MHWGVCISALTGDWLIPGYNADGKINQLYSYRTNKDGRMICMPTPTLTHKLHGIPLWDRSAQDVYICEGIWDALALWELLGVAKFTGTDLMATANGDNLRTRAAVLAVSSCGGVSCLHKFLSLFEGKHPILLFDNDHPRKHESRVIAGQGYKSMQEATSILCNVTQKISYLNWGLNGYDRLLPSGYDVRDQLSEGGDLLGPRLDRLQQLLGKIDDVPKDWLVPSRRSEPQGSEEGCGDCKDWKSLVNSWRKVLTWTDRLDQTLSVMLATVVSTQLVGDQLWIKVIGPPGSGKSELCEALAANLKYVHPISTFTGFHSGYKEDKEGSKDYSLLVQVQNKTLVIKDGDTLLKAPNREQILAEARDLYDGTARTHYRHGMSRRYERLRTTLVLSGTESLRELDTSELGERFLDTVICDEISAELEEAIGLRVIYRAAYESRLQVDGKPETATSPERVAARGMTGGYIGYLRRNAQQLLDLLPNPEQEQAQELYNLALFVSYMRSRPSPKQQEKAHKELSSRLSYQLTRLANCLAVVLNRDGWDEEVMRRVRCVALDTARGLALEIARLIWDTGNVGLASSSLAVALGQEDHTMSKLLKHLKRLKVITVKNVGGVPQWRLTLPLARLYKEVVECHG